MVRKGSPVRVRQRALDARGCVRAGRKIVCCPGRNLAQRIRPTLRLRSSVMLEDARTRVQVVDMFSGCGGMSQGFATASTESVRFDLIGSLDVDRHANATYERMLGITPAEVDVRELEEGHLLEETVASWGLRRDQPLVLIGCAPCQGFSSTARRTSERTIGTR